MLSKVHLDHRLQDGLPERSRTWVETWRERSPEEWELRRPIGVNIIWGGIDENGEPVPMRRVRYNRMNVPMTPLTDVEVAQALMINETSVSVDQWGDVFTILPLRMQLSSLDPTLS